MKQKILATSAILIILLATFASIAINSPAIAQEPVAYLTETIYDYGNDTDGDTLINLLVIEVEVNVLVAGEYRVDVTGFANEIGYHYYFYKSDKRFLDVGMQNISIVFSGISLYARKIDAAKLFGVSLYDMSGRGLDHVYEIALSTVYYYTSFDYGAKFTGTIYDEGVDTDSDGLLNFLRVGVEVNVSDEATYAVFLGELHNDSYYYVNAFISTTGFLLSGIRVLNISLHGASIYASQVINISETGNIDLKFVEDGNHYKLDSESDLNLSKRYNYYEFETLAYLTGKIIDQGINNDANPKFDFLQISVEINVTEAGEYSVELQDLFNDTSNVIYLDESVSGYFDVGTHLMNLTIYGPIIYVSHIDPMYIGMVALHDLDTMLYLGGLYYVPLSKQYSYTEFESHAFLTGNISDMGVDADGDGLYDYLAVGVEINVTEAETYEVSAKELMDYVNSSHISYLYAPQSIVDYFEIGVHMVYLNYSGPLLAYDHFSPTNITGIGFYERVYPYVRLGYIPSYAFPTRHSYTLFDAPLRDMQVDLVVYPNGTMTVGGTVNSPHILPNYGPLTNATINVSTNGDLTIVFANGTIIVPAEMLPPALDSTIAYAISRYNGQFLNASLNAEIFAPPEVGMEYPANASDFSFNATYSNGMLNMKLGGETILPELPFNISDLVVFADYLDNNINGNITFRTVSGFPLGDIIVYVDGNKTDLHFTGHVNVTYGSLFDMEINSTILEGMLEEYNSTIPGPSGLVYNMTWGLLECTEMNTTKTPWYIDAEEAGADVQFDIAIHGNFTGFLAKLLAQMASPSPDEAYPILYAAIDSALSSVQNASLQLMYYSASGTVTMDLLLASDVTALWSKALQVVPPAVPAEFKSQIEAMLKIANATAYAIEDFSFDASYSHVQQKLTMNAWFLANITQLKKDVFPILPGAVPPEMRGIVESYLNTTYATLTSSNATVTYTNGTANFEINCVFEGDFKSQMNHAKPVCIAFLNAMYPGMMSWQLRMLNETEININNFELELKETESWMYLTFHGLIAQPSKDEIDFIRFRLYKFFNATNGDPYEPPREFDKFKITVTAGFNGTHTVLFYSPGTVPRPDEFSLDYKSMTWQNVTLSRLKDLRFLIAYQRVIDYLGKAYYVPVFTNSTVSNFIFNPSAKSISFNVSGVTGAGFCNITIPRKLLYAVLDGWVVKIDGTILNLEDYNVTQNAEYVFIYLGYSHSSHLIEIVGTEIVAEFPPNLLPLILMTLSLIATIIAVKQRKKLATLKTKYQAAMRIFADKIHMSRT